MFRKLATALKAWRKQEDGVTAIEFSLLATPFVLTIVGIIELSMMFLGNAMLNGAVNEAARLIRTGQLQSTTDQDPEEMFTEALCSHSGLFINCGELQYAVTTLDSFSEAEDAQPELDEDGNIVDPPFDAGGVSSIVMIKVIYLYPLLTPLLGTFFSDYPGNKRMMISTVILQTEPYEFEEDEGA